MHLSLRLQASDGTDNFVVTEGRDLFNADGKSPIGEPDEHTAAVSLRTPIRTRLRN